MKSILITYSLVVSLLCFPMRGIAEYLDYELSFPREHCVQSFQGSIGQLLDIQMELSLDEIDQLIGSYMYAQYQQHISLDGTFSADSGNIFLTEYGNMETPGIETGQFDGNFVTPNRIEGVWNDPSGRRTYSFFVERIQQEMATGHCSDGNVFRVISVPVLDEIRWAEDQIQLHMQGKAPLLLTTQWLVSTCADMLELDFLDGIKTSSIAVDMLAGTPELLHISWETYPVARTMGGDCLLIVPAHNFSTRLFDRCLSSSFTQSERDFWWYSGVTYADNLLHITKRHSFWTLDNNDGQPEMREHEVTCIYTVETDHLKLNNISGRTRAAVGEDRGQDLDKRVREVEWQSFTEETNRSCPTFE